MRAGIPFDSVEDAVVVRGIMVKEREALCPRGAGDLGGCSVARVSKAEALGVLLVFPPR